MFNPPASHGIPDSPQLQAREPDSGKAKLLGDVADGHLFVERRLGFEALEAPR